MWTIAPLNALISHFFTHTSKNTHNFCVFLNIDSAADGDTLLVFFFFYGNNTNVHTSEFLENQETLNIFY